MMSLFSINNLIKCLYRNQDTYLTHDGIDKNKRGQILTMNRIGSAAVYELHGKFTNNFFQLIRNSVTLKIFNN